MAILALRIAGVKVIFGTFNGGEPKVITDEGHTVTLSLWRTTELRGARGSRVPSLSAHPAKGQVEDRTFEIEFLDPGIQAFVFTFGYRW
jgi:hypothetical protein